MTYVCVCGHAEDEHDAGYGPCAAMCVGAGLNGEDEPCRCVAYEDDPEAGE